MIQAYSAGCFYVSAQISYDSQNCVVRNYMTLDVKPTHQLPPPSLEKVEFSYSGMDSAIFDAPTDCGMGVTSLKSCSSIFLFNGAGNSTCQYLNSSAILIIPSKVVNVGDNVTLIAGVLKRKCESADPYECSEYSQNLQSSALMEIPKSAMSPVSSLSGPSYVSICSDILLDPTGTYGSGIKDWKSIGWVVSSNANDKTDIVYIEAHLNSNFSSVDRIVVVPTYLLHENVEYTFALSITNFLHKTSVATKSINVGDAGLRV